MGKFVHIHCHTIYSVRDGMIKIDDIIEMAKQNDEAIAITDHGSIAGWLEYYKKSKQNNLKPILGVEIYVNQYRNELFDILNKLKNSKNIEKTIYKTLIQRRDELKKHLRHLVLLAKNTTGVYNIIQLMNDAYINWFYSKPILDYNSLLSLGKNSGLIVTTACLLSPLNHFKSEESKIEFIELMKSVFGDDFYLEVQINNINEQKKYNKEILALSELTNTKIVIGSDSHYLNEEDADTHQDLLLLQNKNTRSDLGKMDIKITYENKNGEIKSKKFSSDTEYYDGHLINTLKPKQKIGTNTIISIEKIPRTFSYETKILWLKSEKELKKEALKFHKELAKHIDIICNNNREIYDKIEEIKLNDDIKLPHIPNATKILIDLIKDGFKAKGFHKYKDRKYLDRIKYELYVIKKFKFETYFLILHDLMKWARENDIGIGAGRGSVAGSFIAYLLDIHRINPFDKRWDTTSDGLPFERFLDMQKLFNKIIIEDDHGNILELMEYDNVTVLRNNQQITIKALELQENDEIVF